MARFFNSFERDVLRWIQAQETIERLFHRHVARRNVSRNMVERAIVLENRLYENLKRKHGKTNNQMYNAKNRLYSRLQGPRTP